MITRAAVAMTSFLSLLCSGCGGNEEARSVAQQTAVAQSSFDPCALLTADEIKSTLGWAPDSSTKKAYGTTGTCNYFGPNAVEQQVSLLVGVGLAAMSDSRKMADWRAKQYADYKVSDAIVEPVSDLGVPAIRNEFGIVAIEMAVGSRLVTVSSLSAKFDKVHALAALVLAHLK